MRNATTPSAKATRLVGSGRDPVAPRSKENKMELVIVRIPPRRSRPDPNLPKRRSKLPTRTNTLLITRTFPVIGAKFYVIVPIETVAQVTS